MIKARSDSFQNKSDLFKSLCVWRSTVMLAESADQKQDDLWAVGVFQVSGLRAGGDRTE